MTLSAVTDGTSRNPACTGGFPGAASLKRARCANCAHGDGRGVLPVGRTPCVHVPPSAAAAAARSARTRRRSGVRARRTRRRHARPERTASRSPWSTSAAPRRRAASACGGAAAEGGVAREHRAAGGGSRPRSRRRAPRRRPPPPSPSRSIDSERSHASAASGDSAGPVTDAPGAAGVGRARDNGRVTFDPHRLAGRPSPPCIVTGDRPAGLGLPGLRRGVRCRGRMRGDQSALASRDRPAPTFAIARRATASSARAARPRWLIASFSAGGELGHRAAVGAVVGHERPGRSRSRRRRAARPRACPCSGPRTSCSSPSRRRRRRSRRRSASALPAGASREQLGEVLLVGRVLAGEARGAHAGRAAERRGLDARVVGDRRAAGRRARRRAP